MMNTILSSSNNERSNLFSSLSMFSSPGSASRAEEDSGSDVEGKVKNRLMSMWNNVKYGMKLKTNFSKESPVWLLGKCYHRKDEDTDCTEVATDVAAFASQNNLGASEEEGLEGFKSDFVSRLWMTYRREFPFLNGSNYTSDCGWGCMLRSGQMLLAQALVNHFLGRDWRWTESYLTTTQDYSKEFKHRKIIKWFGDKQSRNSPLSLHTLVALGEASGKKAGDWYGPGAVAHLLRQAVQAAAVNNPEFETFTVAVAQDCAVYIKDIFEECEMDGRWKSLVLLVPMRLGAEKLNPIYAPALTALLTLEQCIGIIGGRPKHSLYFIGYQDDKLIHLDPHYCQEVVDVWVNDFPVTSFHCRSPRKLHISKMDPSCCVGFYCATKADFLALMEQVRSTINVATRAANGQEYPMFVFCDGYSRESRLSPAKHALPPDMEFQGGSANGVDTNETEEFEVL